MKEMSFQENREYKGMEFKLKFYFLKFLIKFLKVINMSVVIFNIMY